MKNEFDDKYIANEVKKYIDNIQVPEELGGMIMKKVNNENEKSNQDKDDGNRDNPFDPVSFQKVYDWI